MQPALRFDKIEKTQEMAGETMDRKNEYIAVFDSGVGGISVLRQLRRELPQERFLYFGDSANAPYGERSVEEVRALTLAAARMLMSRGDKALVVACNTATAAAIKLLRQEYPDEIIIGIEPAVKLAASHFPHGRIGVMATRVTLQQERFDDLLARHGGGAEVARIPAPGLVELIEQGKADSEETQALLSDILEPWRGKLDALVLGCTHYPFVKKAIARILGQQTELLDGSYGTARETRRRLEEAGLLRCGQGQVVIEDSAPGEAALCLARQLLEQPE